MELRKLTEALTIFDSEHQKVLDEYERMEDDNEHGEAVMLLAKFFKREDLVAKLEHINALHDLYGNLRPELRSLRDEIDFELKPSFLEEFRGYSKEDAEEYVKELRSL